MEGCLRWVVGSTLLFTVIAAGVALPASAVHGYCPVETRAGDACVSDSPAGGRAIHEAFGTGYRTGQKVVDEAIEASRPLIPLISPAIEAIGQVSGTADQYERDGLNLLDRTVTDVDDVCEDLHRDAHELDALGPYTPQDASRHRGDGIELPLGVSITGDLGKCVDREGDVHAADWRMWDNRDRYRVWVEDAPVTVATVANPGAVCEMALPSDRYAEMDCADNPTLGFSHSTKKDLDWVNVGARTVHPQQPGWLRISIWDSSPWGGHTHPVGAHAQGYSVLVRQDASATDAPDAVSSSGEQSPPQAPASRIVGSSAIAPDDPATDERAGVADRVPAHADVPRSMIALAVAALTLASMLLYRRLSRDDVLEHDLRSDILDVVHDDPGVRASELADRYEAALSTIIYHLRILEDSDLLLAVETDDGTRYFHPDNAGTAAQRKVRCALRHETKSALLGELVRDPGRSMADLARALDCDRSTVKRHADDLIEDGILEAEKDGRCKRLLPADGVVEQVAGSA